MVACGGVCVGFFLFIGGLLALWGGTQKYLLLQRVQNTPTSKVRSAAVGLAEFHGKAFCKEPTLSPITRQKCAYYRLHAEYYQEGKHGGWRELYSQTSGKPFYLEDETGKILIDPKDAEIDIPVDNTFQGRIKPFSFLGIAQAKIDPKVIEYVNSAPSEAKGRFNAYGDHNLRVSEYFIAEGDEVYVMGSVQPFDGAKSSASHENLIVKKNPNEAFFYISDSSEKRATSKIRDSAIWGIIWGLLFGGGGLLVFVFSFFLED
jgi:hypothetical protein